MLEVRRDNPFPYGMRGDLLHGAVFERKIDESTSQYIIVRPLKYDYSMVVDFGEEGLSPLGSRRVVKLIGYLPGDDVYWLYHMLIFEVNQEFHKNQRMFSENRRNIQEFGFDDINKVLYFCKKEFDIKMEDFKKDWETNYPQK